MRRPSLALILTGAALLCLVAPASGAKLKAGAGRADIQPPTGYYMMGWVRSDSKTIGQHTRLFARALVLKRGKRKVALVAEDLNAIPGGMVQDATELLHDRGFSPRNVIVSASHTHAGPTGYFNYGTYNTVFPTLFTPADFNIANTAADPQLYGFMVRQLAAAIRRADDDLAPATAGWGAARIAGLTRNRSLEAHLANHGILLPRGQGQISDDPGGYVHTIDPQVNVLRVDKLLRRGGRAVRRPIGIWATFADHGTVNPPNFLYYNADHHGAATRVVEGRLRRAGRVPRRQEVVNVYGNTDEGDQSAGLDRTGPAEADHVGRVEAKAMLRAWRRASRRMGRRPKLAWRWTRICFCGQQTEGGAVDNGPVVGLPLFTGSEEGRGPLFDITGVPLEDMRSPTHQGPQGHKIQISRDSGGGTPTAVPLTAMRLGSRLIVTVPGEMTAEMGRRVRAAVLAAARPPGARASTRRRGIRRAVISGIANEYVQYFTTPEEYERQHYEGGSTLFGEFSSNLIRESLVTLTERLVRGRAAPDPYPFDATNGVIASQMPFDSGAETGSVEVQPADTPRSGQARFSWRGAERGFDRPLERAFVTIQRGTGGRWKRVTDDLGLQILWSVDPDGVYQASWEVPLGARTGSYRFLITANRYTLASARFGVSAARTGAALLDHRSMLLWQTLANHHRGAAVP
ncbi:MAG: neutral/alkaline non-lysosomal ceramidase N-terminal domain-containing protein [Actinomycetota bacterium]